MQYDVTDAYARERDADDDLRSLRSEFLIPRDETGNKLIYFVGHSLGLQPKSAAAAVHQELDAWAARGVDAHFRGHRPWTRYHEILAPAMARVVGARPHEIILMNGLTVNLHLMMISFYRPSASRYKVVMEDHAFPSDRYAVESQVRLHGHEPTDAIIVIEARQGEPTLRTEDIVETIRSRSDEIALVMLGGVNYYTGQAFDLGAITAAAREVGCMVGFDLAHAAGNIELRLHDWDVDFAVWCMYKYLNSGPGALAGCFVHERHGQGADIRRLAGWWGEDVDKRFEMQGRFVPMNGAGGWQISNPNVMSLAVIRSSLEIFERVGMDRLLKKQRDLTGYLEFLIRRRLGGRVDILTPEDREARGSQLSLLVSNGGIQVYDTLRQSGVVCDWRNPDVIRVAPVPMYNSFEEVWRFVDLLDQTVPKRH